MLARIPPQFTVFGTVVCNAFPLLATVHPPVAFLKRRHHGEGDRQKRPKHQEYLGQTYTRLTTMAPCRSYPLERYPLYENSVYTRQIVWWDTEEYRVQRIGRGLRVFRLLQLL
jgi:hypothetical protein